MRCDNLISRASGKKPQNKTRKILNQSIYRNRVNSLSAIKREQVTVDHDVVDQLSAFLFLSLFLAHRAIRVSDENIKVKWGI